MSQTQAYATLQPKLSQTIGSFVKSKRINGMKEPATQEQLKQNLMNALETIDEGKVTSPILSWNNFLCIEKKGLVRLRVLLNLMECMDFPLPREEAERIRT